MSNKMIYFVCIGSILLGSLSGCDEYEVKEVPKSIYVDKESLTLFVGEQIQLQASPTDGTYTYSWASEDPSIATVSANGLVEAVGEGSTNIVVSGGGSVRTLIPVSSLIRIPLEDVVLSESHMELMPGDEKSILVTLVPLTANDVPDRSWHSEDPDIAMVSEMGEVTAVREGVTSIVFRSGDIEKTILVEVSYTRPFKGPHILSAAQPVIVFAADFDYGGEGHAFHDADPGNAVGNDNYRRGQGDTQSFAVEIEGDGTNVGYMNAGEWLQYTVEVHDAGDYWLEVGLSAAADAQFRIEVDGENVTGSVPVPNNGSWGDWRLFPNPPLVVNFTEGKHKIRFFVEQSGFNLRGLQFTKK